MAKKSATESSASRKPLTIPDILREAVRKYKTMQKVGELMRVNPSRLSRLLNKDPEYSLNVENCLRLANLTGRSAPDVLRAAGRTDVAALVTALSGEGPLHEQTAGTVQSRNIQAEVRESLDRILDTAYSFGRRSEETSALLRELGSLLAAFEHQFHVVDCLTELISRRCEDTDRDGLIADGPKVYANDAAPPYPIPLGADSGRSRSNGETPSPRRSSLRRKTA